MQARNMPCPAEGRQSARHIVLMELACVLVTPSARNVLEQALALSEDDEDDRRRVAEALLDSLPAESTREAQDIEGAWRDEVLRRIGEVERGEVEPEPWPGVHQRIRDLLGR
jgi:hypothetical protein